MKLASPAFWISSAFYLPALYSSFSARILFSTVRTFLRIAAVVDSSKVVRVIYDPSIYRHVMRVYSWIVKNLISTRFIFSATEIIIINAINREWESYEKTSIRMEFQQTRRKVIIFASNTSHLCKLIILSRKSESLEYTCTCIHV